jgi:hypothetical protein
MPTVAKPATTSTEKLAAEAAVWGQWPSGLADPQKRSLPAWDAKSSAAAVDLFFGREGTEK